MSNPLALLTQTQAALKDREKKCVHLEEELHVKLAEKESCSERMEGPKKESSETGEARKELADL